MRWVEGQLAPVGGQAQYAYPPFASRCRAIHGWYGLDGIHYIAYLCETNIYVDTGGVLSEITPVDGMIAPLVPGEGGYSDGLYADGLYATERPASLLPIDVLPNAWSLDNFGQILLAMTSPDGRLAGVGPQRRRHGRPSRGDDRGDEQRHRHRRRPARAAVRRHPGAVRLRSSAWSTTARRRRLDAAFRLVRSGEFPRLGFQQRHQPGGLPRHRAGEPDRGGAGDPQRHGLLDRPQGVSISSFLGIPYVYNYVELGNNCTPWSPESVIVSSSMALWMSQQGMFSFDGTSIVPIACKVRPWVDDDIDLINVREQACAVHVGNFNEFWWFFPQLGQPYNTRCIIYNYKEGWWSQGTMSRSAGITASFTAQTIMADGLVAFEHELGIFYGNAALPWARRSTST